MGTHNPDIQKPASCAECFYCQICTVFLASYGNVNKNGGFIDHNVRNWWRDLDQTTWLPTDHRLSGCPLTYVYQEYNGQPDGYVYTYPDNTTNCWPTTADYASGGQYASLNN